MKPSYSPTRIVRICKKAISAVLTVTFLLTNTLAYADNPIAKHTLTPPLRLARESFKESYIARHALLENIAANGHIAEKIKELGSAIKTRPDIIRLDVDGIKQDLEITIVSIPGLLSSTRGSVIAHAGLGTQNGYPVIYIDSRYEYNEEILQCYRDEIAAWEAKRRSLELSYEAMREWVRSDRSARELADAFVDASMTVDDLYEKYGRRQQEPLTKELESLSMLCRGHFLQSHAVALPAALTEKLARRSPSEDEQFDPGRDSMDDRVLRIEELQTIAQKDQREDDLKAAFVELIYDRLDEATKSDIEKIFHAIQADSVLPHIWLFFNGYFLARQHITNSASFGDYLSFIRQKGPDSRAERNVVCEEVYSAFERIPMYTRASTKFFHFDSVKDTAQEYLSGLIDQKMRAGDLSITAKTIGISSGEEPYSLAMHIYYALKRYYGTTVQKGRAASESEDFEEWLAGWNITIEACDKELVNLALSENGLFDFQYDDPLSSSDYIVACDDPWVIDHKGTVGEIWEKRKTDPSSATFSFRNPALAVLKKSPWLQFSLKYKASEAVRKWIKPTYANIRNKESTKILTQTKTNIIIVSFLYGTRFLSEDDSFIMRALREEGVDRRYRSLVCFGEVEIIERASPSGEEDSRQKGEGRQSPGTSRQEKQDDDCETRASPAAEEDSRQEKQGADRRRSPTSDTEQQEEASTEGSTHKETPPVTSAVMLAGAAPLSAAGIENFSSTVAIGFGIFLVGLTSVSLVYSWLRPRLIPFLQKIKIPDRIIAFLMGSEELFFSGFLTSGYLKMGEYFKLWEGIPLSVTAILCVTTAFFIRMLHKDAGVLYYFKKGVLTPKEATSKGLWSVFRGALAIRVIHALYLYIFSFTAYNNHLIALGVAALTHGLYDAASTGENEPLMALGPKKTKLPDISSDNTDISSKFIVHSSQTAENRERETEGRIWKTNRTPYTVHREPNTPRASPSADDPIEDPGETFAGERIFYAQTIEWAKYLLENRDEKFGADSKLLFMGGACRSVHQATSMLANRYGVDQDDILYAELPTDLLKRTPLAHIKRSLERAGALKPGVPVAVIDVALENGTTRDTLGGIFTANGQDVKFHCLYGARFVNTGIDAYELTGRLSSGDAGILYRFFEGDEDPRDTRTRRAVYINEDGTTTFLYFSDVAVFLKERVLNEKDNIHTITPGELFRDESRRALPLIQRIAQDEGHRHGYDRRPNIRKLRLDRMRDDLAMRDYQDRLFFHILSAERASLMAREKGSGGKDLRRSPASESNIHDSLPFELNEIASDLDRQNFSAADKKLEDALSIFRRADEEAPFGTHHQFFADIMRVLIDRIDGPAAKAVPAEELRFIRDFFAQLRARDDIPRKDAVCEIASGLLDRIETGLTGSASDIAHIHNLNEMLRGRFLSGYQRQILNSVESQPTGSRPAQNRDVAEMFDWIRDTVLLRNDVTELPKSRKKKYSHVGSAVTQAAELSAATVGDLTRASDPARTPCDILRTNDGEPVIAQYSRATAQLQPFFAVIIHHAGIPLRVIIKDKRKYSSQSYDFTSDTVGNELLGAINAPMAWLREGERNTLEETAERESDNAVGKAAARALEEIEHPLWVETKWFLTEYPTMQRIYALNIIAILIYIFRKPLATLMRRIKPVRKKIRQSAKSIAQNAEGKHRAGDRTPLTDNRKPSSSRSSPTTEAVPMWDGVDTLVSMVREKIDPNREKPVVLAIRGDSSVGKSRLLHTIVHGPETGVAVLDEDDCYKTDAFGNAWFSYRKYVSRLRELYEDPFNKLILLTGFRCESVEDIPFDIKVKLLADEATRAANLKEKSRWASTIYDGSGALETVSDDGVEYDLILDNSAPHRLGRDSRIDFIKGEVNKVGPGDKTPRRSPAGQPLSPEARAASERLASMKAKLQAAGFDEKKSEIITAQLWIDQDYVGDDIDVGRLMEAMIDKVISLPITKKRKHKKYQMLASLYQLAIRFYKRNIDGFVALLNKVNEVPFLEDLPYAIEMGRFDPSDIDASIVRLRESIARSDEVMASLQRPRDSTDETSSAANQHEFEIREEYQKEMGGVEDRINIRYENGFSAYANFTIADGTMLINTIQPFEHQEEKPNESGHIRNWDRLLLGRLIKHAKEKGCKVILFSPPAAQYRAWYTWNKQEPKPYVVYRHYSVLPFDLGFRLQAGELIRFGKRFPNIASHLAWHFAIEQEPEAEAAPSHISSDTERSSPSGDSSSKFTVHSSQIAENRERGIKDGHLADNRTPYTVNRTPRTSRESPSGKELFDVTLDWNPFDKDDFVDNETCRICGSDTIENPDITYIADGMKFEVLRCVNDGFMWITPEPNEEAMKKKMYGSEQYFGKGRVKQPNSGSPNWRDIVSYGYTKYANKASRRKRAGKLDRLVADPFFSRHLDLSGKQQDRILDVGAAEGAYLLALNRVGYPLKNLYASELSTSAIEQAIKSGIPEENILSGDIEGIDVDTYGRFDAVTAFDLLEHLYDPAGFLKKIRSMLKEGGRLLMVVPTCSEEGPDIFKSLEHVNYFSPQAMRRVLEDVGFDDVEIEVHRKTTTDGVFRLPDIMHVAAYVKGSVDPGDSKRPIDPSTGSEQDSAPRDEPGTSQGRHSPSGSAGPLTSDSRLQTENPDLPASTTGAKDEIPDTRYDRRDRRTPQTPASTLEAIKHDDELFRRALPGNGGIEGDESFVTLELLGIMKQVEGKPGWYEFSDLLIGPDGNHTKTIINAICDMRYQINGYDEDRPLCVEKLKDREITTVRELVKMTALNQINLMLTPNIPETKTLWHIVENELLADSQQGSFAQQINKASRESQGPERIYITRPGESAEEARAHILAKDYNAIFDAALATSDAASSLPNDVKTLIFDGAAGDLTHLEGILAALRALHLPKERVIPTLKRIYAALGATPNAANKSERELLELLDKPQEFARSFIYTLPPSSAVPVQDLPKINTRLRELITAA
ncbi:MAG: methyltransferase domain-containing protein [Candidatus Omnitrophota bacterium]